MARNYSAEDLEEVRTLERTRVALAANRQRRIDIRNSYLGNKELENAARLQAWAKVGRVTGTVDKPVMPAGWPSPYKDWADWLAINFEGWSTFLQDDGGSSSSGGSEQEKALARFREQVEGAGGK